MKAFNWRCPFCDHDTTVTDERCSAENHRIRLESKHGNQVIKTMVIACPNESCKELYVLATMGGFTDHSAGRFTSQLDHKVHSTWTLRPQGSVKPFPDYIPSAIRSDYAEACLIRDLSPKASATLSRRCLQGMIRDFWGVTKNRLVDEIDALQDKVDAQTWAAIDAVRTIGNVGAHMEKDINLIVDVAPNEAALLIQLIENLLVDWYVERHERTQRMSQVVAAADAKKTSRSAPRSTEASVAPAETEET